MHELRNPRVLGAAAYPNCVIAISLPEKMNTPLRNENPHRPFIGIPAPQYEMAMSSELPSEDISLEMGYLADEYGFRRDVASMLEDYGFHVAWSGDPDHPFTVVADKARADNTWVLGPPARASVADMINVHATAMGMTPAAAMLNDPR